MPRSLLKPKFEDSYMEILDSVCYSTNWPQSMERGICPLEGTLDPKACTYFTAIPNKWGSLGWIHRYAVLLLGGGWCKQLWHQRRTLLLKGQVTFGSNPLRLHWSLVTLTTWKVLSSLIPFLFLPFQGSATSAFPCSWTMTPKETHACFITLRTMAAALCKCTVPLTPCRTNIPFPATSTLTFEEVTQTTHLN